MSTLTRRPAVPPYHQPRAGGPAWLPWLALLAAYPAILGAYKGISVLVFGLLPDRLPLLGRHTDVGVTELCIAAVLPLLLLYVRYGERRPVGTLAAAAGRPRWGLLGRCLIAAVIVQLPAALYEKNNASRYGWHWVGWDEFVPAFAALGALAVAYVSTEEGSRGLLMQLIGRALGQRRPWRRCHPLVLVLTAAAFAALFQAAMHNPSGPWGWTYLVGYGLIVGWLTVATGGLEAAWALHLVITLRVNLFVVGYLPPEVVQADAHENAGDISAGRALWSLLMTALYAWWMIELRDEDRKDKR